MDKALAPDAPPKLARLLALLQASQKLEYYQDLAKYMSGNNGKELYARYLLAQRDKSWGLNSDEESEIEQIIFRAETRREYEREHGNWKPPSKR